MEYNQPVLSVIIYDHRQMTVVIKIQRHIINNVVSKSQFKAKALEIFRYVEASNDSIIVTDHGKPAIEVRKYQAKESSPLELLKDSVIEYIDPEEPVGLDEWKTLK